MIPVQDLYNGAVQMVRFSQSGDFSVPEFNTCLTTVENQLYSQLREKGLIDADSQMNLMPFRNPYAPVQTPNGVYTYPTDYFEYIAIGSKTAINGKELPIAVISDAKWGALSTSRLIDLNDNPIIRLAENNLQLLPVTANLHMIYYKKIVNAVYAVTYVNLEPVYDPANSVDSMFQPSMFNVLLDMLVIEISKSLRDNGLLSATTQTLNV